MTRQPVCKDCRYWSARCKDAEYRYPGVKYGECRRYPPKVIELLTMFPETATNSWCGEHKGVVYENV